MTAEERAAAFETRDAEGRLRGECMTEPSTELGGER